MATVPLLIRPPILPQAPHRPSGEPEPQSRRGGQDGPHNREGLLLLHLGLATATGCSCKPANPCWLK